MKQSPERKLSSITKNYDVVVIGGGIAGVMAACAAADAGGAVLLAEGGSVLGGVVTQGPLEAMMTQSDMERKVIAGLADELLEGLAASGSAKSVEDTTGYCSRIVLYDPEWMKQALADMLSRRGAAYLLDTVVYGAERSGDTLTGIRLQARNASFSVSGKAFVDCSGSGTLARLSGNDVLLGDDTGCCQPVTMLSRWGGVDREALRAYVREHREDFKCFLSALDLDAEYLHLWGFTGALREGWESGALSLYREELHMMELLSDGEVVVNYSRVNADPSDPFSMSHAQLLCSRQVYELFAWFRETIPAFRHATVLQSGYVGVRESGRIRARRILERQDILNARDDGTSVAMGAFPIDIHRPGSGMRFERVLKGYCIPAGALMADGTNNLFAGGRCIGSTFEANGSCRISLTCAATGQAAGVMAALYARDPDAWSVEAVRQELRRQNAVIV